MASLFENLEERVEALEREVARIRIQLNHLSTTKLSELVDDLDERFRMILMEVKKGDKK